MAAQVEPEAFPLGLQPPAPAPVRHLRHRVFPGGSWLPARRTCPPGPRSPQPRPVPRRSIAAGSAASRLGRFGPKASNAPALIRASTGRRPSFCPPARRQNSCEAAVGAALLADRDDVLGCAPPNALDRTEAVANPLLTLDLEGVGGDIDVWRQHAEIQVRCTRAAARPAHRYRPSPSSSRRP